MTLGQRIGEARRRTGLSQAQVAERLGVSRQAVSKWETDGSRPDTGNLLRLAELFDVPLEELALERPVPAVASKAAGPGRRRRITLGVVLCGALVLCLLHWAPVDLEAGGTSQDSPERALAYAQRVYGRYEARFLAWAEEHADGMEGAALTPGTLNAYWSGRDFVISFRLEDARGRTVAVRFAGARVWPDAFRWDEQSIRLVTP